MKGQSQLFTFGLFDYEGITVSQQIPLHLPKKTSDWCIYYDYSENIFFVHAAFGGKFHDCD